MNFTNRDANFNLPSAVDLQQLLEENKTTSAQIVEEYLAQIDRYEPALNALISPAPRDKVLKIAKARDEERQKGQIRGPFHEIPIVLKESLVTASELGMSTTAGSVAFLGVKASRNGAITQRLIDAGLIILVKANMTEFAGLKMTMMMAGWSAHGGQTLSPYVGKIEDNEKILGHSAPGSSSTGSAVAVAAGFSPLAMATETIGFIVTPSTRAALYALKPTTGGFLDPKDWSMSPDFCTQLEGTAEKMVDEYEETIFALRNGGCPLKYPIHCKDPSVLPNTILPIAYWDFKNVSTYHMTDSFKTRRPHQASSCSYPIELLWLIAQPLPSIAHTVRLHFTGYEQRGGWWRANQIDLSPQ
ncbi:amidase signature domain-containing protein [Aspergillus minisclerotigenes]|uniref:Amidase signature domain-containing protein n=1 Tax=Aspergillus minisclerotigenes TaxID=656917 RepID=A0A5N6JL12_9EURO|nr:amidase signature domain-containing protein [Aspergillus minisclerotigenes]